MKELTRAYVTAFNAKDALGCAALMADDFALEDPVVKRVEGQGGGNEGGGGDICPLQKSVVCRPQHLRGRQHDAHRVRTDDRWQGTDWNRFDRVEGWQDEGAAGLSRRLRN